MNTFMNTESVSGKFNSYMCSSQSFSVVQNGEKSRNPAEFDCPPGWTWEDDWTVDDNRAVDDLGAETGKIVFLLLSCFRSLK